MSAGRLAIAPELAVLLAAAFAARLAVIYLAPNIHWPDEIYQAMEPAHRLVFGNGAVAWEWVVGARSWLLPGFFAALMEVGRLFGNSPLAIDFPIYAVMALAGCAPAFCAYRWGEKFFGPSGAVVAAVLPAAWVDLIYMSGHTLAEVLAADFLPVALYLGLPVRDAAVSRRRLWAAGAVLGLIVDLRFHLAPALLVAAICICGRRGGNRRWLAVIAGACGPVLALGLLDWASLGHPFQSIVLNVWFNLHQSGAYAGRAPWATLIVLPFALWNVGAVAILAAAIAGARRFSAPALVAIAIFAVYSFVAHKEYRFIYPALPLIAILAGFGTAELLRVARQAWPKLLAHAAIPAALAILFWLGTSAAIAQSPIYRNAWMRARPQLLAFDYVSRRGDLCGVGLYGMKWAITPGHSRLPPAAGFYQSSRDGLASDAAAFNYLVAWERTPPPDGRYRRLACFGAENEREGGWPVGVCVWRRDRGCAPAAAAPFPVNWPGTLAGKPAMGKEYDWTTPDDR